MIGLYWRQADTGNNEEQKRKLKAETDKKLSELKAKAASKKSQSLNIILHFVTKVNPKASKVDVQAYQQKTIAAVA